MISILLATYNKDNLIYNVIYSIARQKTLEPIELCWVDDCSINDPMKYIDGIDCSGITIKYNRLDKNHGGRHVSKFCMNMIDKKSDNIIVMSSDIILCNEYDIENLCAGLSEGNIHLAQVKNIPINFKINDTVKIDNVLAKWGDYKDKTIYSGSKRRDGHTFFFLAAAKKVDLYKIGYDTLNCDNANDIRLRERGIRIVYRDSIKAIHQSHKAKLHVCNILNSCPYAKIKSEPSKLNCFQRFERARKKNSR